MKTTFETHNAEYTRTAHMAARRLVYPQLFGVRADELAFRNMDFNNSEIDRILDGHLGVDVVTFVVVQGFRAPLEFTIQERFRRPEYSGYGDFTITEWNHASDQPSELYKLKAMLFVYGYFNDVTQRFSDVIAADVCDMMTAIISGKLPVARNHNKKQQSFISIKTEAAAECGVLRYWQQRDAAHLAQPAQGRRIRSLSDLVELWTALLIRFKKEYGLAKMAFFYDAKPVAYGDEIVLEFSREFHYAKACEAASTVDFSPVINRCCDRPARLKFQLKQGVQ